MSVYLRGKIWWTHFVLNDEDHRHSLKTSDKREAGRAETRLKGEAGAGRLSGRPLNASSSDFANALKQFLRDRQPYIAPSTARGMVDHSNPLTKFFPAQAGRVSRINEAHVREYISARHHAGRSNATINKELGILIGILEHAGCEAIAKRIELLPVKESEIGRAIEHGEKLRLLKMGRSNPAWQRARLAMLLALNTTMRSGEIRNLQWRDVNWLEEIVFVRRGKTRGSRREIPLNRDALEAMKELREDARTQFGENLLPEWYVFYWGWGSKCEPEATRPARSWRRAWRHLTRSIECPRCGLIQDPAPKKKQSTCANEVCSADITDLRSPTAGLRFHDLRHQAITELAEGKASDETIMSIAGHVNRRMMSHYSHIRRDARRTALDRLVLVQSDCTVEESACNLMKNGGDDGTRTRDLCRDRAAF